MGLPKDRKNMGLSLIGITALGCSFQKPFFARLQSKLGCNDDIIRRIQNAFAKHILIKIEEYEGSDNWSFPRAKVWINWENKRDYYEFEDIDLYGDTPCWFWDLRLDEVLTEEERKEENISSLGIEIVFDAPLQSFIIYISGEKFENKNESMVDLRLLKDKMMDSAILFSLKPFDFEALEEYNADSTKRTFTMPDDPDYFIQTDYHRRYGTLYSKRENNWKAEILWMLNLYDFTRSKFPKAQK